MSSLDEALQGKIQAGPRKYHANLGHASHIYVNNILEKYGEKLWNSENTEKSPDTSETKTPTERNLNYGLRLKELDDTKCAFCPLVPQIA